MINRMTLKLAPQIASLALVAICGEPFEAVAAPREEILNHHITCQQVLKEPGPVFMNTESIPKDEAEALHKAALIVTKIAHDLGLETPPHQVNLVPSDQLNVMATTGGHAAPHWKDGADLIGALTKSMGILEFVTPGCPTCRGYYSASTPFVEQVSVLMHVMGHNDMASTSTYENSRPGDGPWAALHLAKRIEEAYREEGHDQVSLYFQFLKSVANLQDFVYGTFESPDKFNIRKLQPIEAKPGQSLFESLGKDYPKKTNMTKTWSRTPSILQFLVHNLPEHAPGWQKDLVNLFEQTNRFYPSIFNNKIMNEGWATLMQYLIARHSPWSTSDHSVTFGQLLSGVAWPSFDNPYWLGLSGWNNLYEQFKERPEIVNLSEFEKDKRFIAWARAMYADKSDSEWARVALDERWIRKQNLFLYRRQQWEEFDWSIPFEKQQYVTLSRDWKRIQHYLIRTYVDIKYLYRPNFVIRNPTTSSRAGTIEMDQDTSLGFPLEINSASKTLYILSQILQKPVTLKGLFNLPINAPPAEDPYEHLPWSPAVFPLPPWAYRPVQIPKEALLTDLTVDPSGAVTIHGTNEEIHNKILGVAAINKKLTEGLGFFKEDVLQSFHDESMKFEPNRWSQLQTAVSDSAMDNLSHIIYFSPTTHAAVREYLNLIEKRLRGRLQAAIDGKAPIQFKSTGVGINVLPEIPQLRYDFKYINEHIRNKPVGPIDQGSVVSSNFPFDVDDNGTEIRKGPLMPGDRFGLKPPPGQDGDGDGDGEGDGDPEDGDATDGDTDADGQGSGAGNTPTDLVVPLELYGELLSEMLELPNIRRTEGSENDFETVKRGSVRRPSGDVIWEHTLIQAVDKARAVRKAKGLPYGSNVPFMTIVQEALKLLDSSDYFVKSETVEPLPDFDAVMVVSVDMTGSMGGDRIRNAKNLLYNLKALLKAKYKNVVFRYIAFSDHAIEMSEKDVFSKFMGGGTAYAPAIVKTSEILNEYPNSRYNKYILTIGDGETGDGDAFVNEIDKIKDDLQYAGFAATNTKMGANFVLEPLMRLQSQWPWMGITSIVRRDEIFNALKDLFPKGGIGKE